MYFVSYFKGVLLKAGPRPSGPAAPQPTARDRPGGPESTQFCCPAVNPRACRDLHRFGRAKTVSLNSFAILIIISILFDPFLRCTLLSEKRCHSLLFSSFYRTRSRGSQLSNDVSYFQNTV